MIFYSPYLRLPIRLSPAYHSPRPMTNRAKITTTVLLLLALTGVGAADYYFAGREYAADVTGQQPNTGTTAGGVAKAEEVDVEATLTAMGFTLAPSEDLTFLAQVAQNQEVNLFTILLENDRVGSVSWIDGDSKQALISLKEALLSAFSSDVTGLSDKTVQTEGLPTINVLTFRDPALSEETLTFVRIRERLYEFHSAQSQPDAVNNAIEALTAR